MSLNGLLGSAISTGHAHLATRDGTAPADPGTCGWRAERTRNHRRAEWLPQGARVGWLDDDDLYLDIDSAYRAAQVMAPDGDGIAVGIQTLVKRLREAGWLKSVDERRGKLKVRRVIDGSRAEADAYWPIRPRQSQLAASASHQSARLRSRTELLARYARLARIFQGPRNPAPAVLDWISRAS